LSYFLQNQYFYGPKFLKPGWEQDEKKGFGDKCFGKEAE